MVTVDQPTVYAGRLKVCLLCPHGRGNPPVCQVDRGECRGHARRGDCPEKRYPSDEALSAIPVPTSAPTGGPGTELAKLLRRFWIGDAPGCRCSQHAARMDREGVEWCAANVDYLAGLLVDEARARRWPILPFLTSSARLLVKAAVRNARKARR